MAARKIQKKVKKVIKRKKAVKSRSKGKPLASKKKNPKIVSFAKRKEFSSGDVAGGSIKLAIKYFGVLAIIIGIPVIFSVYQDIMSVSAKALGNTVPLWISITGGISNLLLTFLGIGTLLIIAKKESGEEITGVNEYLDIIFKQAVLRIPRLLLVGLVFVGVAVAIVLPIFIFVFLKAPLLVMLYSIVITVYCLYLTAKYGQAFPAAILTPKYSKLFKFSANITEGNILNIIFANFLITFVILIPALTIVGVTFLARKYGASIMPGFVLVLISAFLTMIMNITATAFQYNLFMELKSTYYGEDERI